MPSSPTMKIILFFQVVVLAMTVHAIKCDEISPFQVPIRDVQVIPEIPNSFMKGIPVTIGTPPQDIVLLPWPELNNTWIYDKGYCNSQLFSTTEKCRVWRGNYYQESESTTWARENDVILAGGAPIEVEAPGEAGIRSLVTSSVGGTDEFTLKTTDGLVGFPIGVPTIDWDYGGTMLHAMGMGTNSTILNAFYKTRRIGSRVWSIFWGRMWVDAGDALDGSVVFGGYDQLKTTGKGYTQSLDFSENSGCWTGMKVQISNITLRNALGQENGLLDTSSRLLACIVPQHQLLLHGPASIIDKFVDKTYLNPVNISLGLHKGAYQFNESDMFGLDMTILLSTGLEIRVPANQYFVPFVDFDDNGSRVIDTQKRELLIGDLMEPNTAILGRYFLTAAYLMVDLDANNFTLWQANPTPDSKLLGHIGSECESTASKNSNTSSSHARLPRGSIAGIAIGVTAGLAILSLGILFYIRRIRRRHQSNQAATEPLNPSGEVSRRSELPVLDNTKTLPSPGNELHGSPAAVSEVSGQAHHAYEMDGGTLREG